MESDKFWLDDISILYNYNRIAEFYPSNDMSSTEKLNAILRLSIYFSIIMGLYKKDLKYMLIILIVACLTIFVYRKEKKPESNCTMPTKTNPFMNKSVIEMSSDKPIACDINNEDVKKDMKDGFENNLYMDVTDLFEKKNSQRQFYTVPPIIDDGKFNNWIANIPASCKDDNKACDGGYTPLKSNKFIYPFPDQPIINTEAREQLSTSLNRNYGNF